MDNYQEDHILCSRRQRSPHDGSDAYPVGPACGTEAHPLHINAKRIKSNVLQMYVITQL